MYQLDALSTLRLPRPETLQRVWTGVGRTVLALGCTSLLTDVSSEMVSTVLPIYLVLQLGLTPLQFGLVDGIYQGITALVRLLGGLAADRSQRHKEIAAAGYGISALCKIGLGAAGASWPVLAGVVAVDRMGKGVRTAPRDALISLSTAPAQLGMAFGVHRAFDSAGAMLGPLVALVILANLPDRFDLVFVVSFGFAIVGLGVLLLFAENVRQPPVAGAADAPPRPLALEPGQLRSLAGLMTAAALLSVATVSDAFLYLLLQREAGFNAAPFPLLYVGTAGGFLVLAVPAGRLADRVGRRVTFLGGHALLVLAYLLTTHQHPGPVIVASFLLLLGGYYAMTDGVLMTLASGMCRPAQRASGMALVTTVTSAARFVAPVAFGALWMHYDATTAVRVFTCALIAAVALAGVILRFECGTCEADVPAR